MNAVELRAITDEVRAKAEEAKQATAVKFWNETAMPHMIEQAKAGHNRATLRRPDDVTEHWFSKRVRELAEAEGYVCESNYNEVIVCW